VLSVRSSSLLFINESNVSYVFCITRVAFICVEPRMPSDPKGCSIGGRMSSPFRRALLGLLLLATTRFVISKMLDMALFHVALIDGILVTCFNVGLSFLCMITSYILQCQLTNLINIHPGKDLVPYLIAVFVMTVAGITAARTTYPNLCALVSLAGAVSSIPVIKTLTLYARLTTLGGNQGGRGNVITQILLSTEYYYVFSCLVAFLAEVFYRGPNVEDYKWTDELIDSMRHHQDIGVDDWTRLLVHSIFLNLIDELTHVAPPRASAASTSRTPSADYSTASSVDLDVYDDEEDKEHMQMIPIGKHSQSSFDPFL
jgi:hypothetical protein